MLAARQRLKGDDFVVTEARRLETQNEAVAFNIDAQGALERVALAQACVHLRFKETHGGFALCLGAVKRNVSLAQERFSVVSPSWGASATPIAAAPLHGGPCRRLPDLRDFR